MLRNKSEIHLANTADTLKKRVRSGAWAGKWHYKKNGYRKSGCQENKLTVLFQKNDPPQLQIRPLPSGSIRLCLKNQHKLTSKDN